MRLLKNLKNKVCMREINRNLINQSYLSKESYQTVIQNLEKAVNAHQPIYIDNQGKMHIATKWEVARETIKGWFSFFGLVNHTSDPWIKNSIKALKEFGEEKTWNSEDLMDRLTTIATRLNIPLASNHFVETKALEINTLAEKTLSTLPGNNVSNFPNSESSEVFNQDKENSSSDNDPFLSESTHKIGSLPIGKVTQEDEGSSLFQKIIKVATIGLAVIGTGFAAQSLAVQGFKEESNMETSSLQTLGSDVLSSTEKLPFSPEPFMQGKVFPITALAETNFFTMGFETKGRATLEKAQEILGREIMFSEKLEKKNFPSEKGQIQNLQKEILFFRERLQNAVESAPQEETSQKNVSTWVNETDELCFAINTSETCLLEAMNAARTALDATTLFDESCGRKHSNILKQAHLVKTLGLPGITVPLPHGISSDIVTAFLRTNSPAILENWEALSVLYEHYSGPVPFLETEQAKKHLEFIDNYLAQAFNSASEEEMSHFFPPDYLEWLASVRDSGDYLMVRSSASEDSKKAAGAGANTSEAYVDPEVKVVFSSIGKVVRSYFSPFSVQNRINAKINPFEELSIGVTTQQLIGESIDGGSSDSEIPVSMVMFSTEPLYVGEEAFHLTRISATFGHGNGVVANLGIISDTIHVLQSVSNPERLTILYDNQKKPYRLAPVTTPKGIELEMVKNPPELTSQRTLTDKMITRLFEWGTVLQSYYEGATDMEIIVKNGEIFPVQARPANRPAQTPTYIDFKKISSISKNPIQDTVTGELILQGTSSVLKIYSPDKILYTETLDEADQKFRLGTHELVMVAQPEPNINSHPVVNFSERNIPCLFMPDVAKTRTVIKQINKDFPSAICVQTATVQIWDESIAKPSDLHCFRICCSSC